MAIITATEYKAYRGISGTDHDSALAVIIPAVQSRAESFCGRLFDSAERTEKASGDGTQKLILKHWPITAIDSIVVTTGSTSTTLESSDYAIAEKLDACIFRKPFDGSLALGGQDEWGAPILRGTLSPCWPIGNDNVTVVYTAGYTSGTMPDDLKLLMFELVDDQMNHRGQSWRLAAEGQGNQTQTLRAAIDLNERYRSMLAPWRRLP